MANIKLLDLLLETLTKAKADYLDKDKIDRITFEEFKTLDTTKTFKYIELICYLYYELKISKDELNQVFSIAIEHLESKKVRYDIQKIKTKNDYEDFKSKVLDVKYTNSDLQKYKNHEGVEVVYEDKRVTVLHIKTMEAAIALGRGTAWCISYTDEEKNQFNNYISSDRLTIYILFDNTKPNSNNLSKLCVVVNKKNNIVEIKSKDQVYNGEEHRDYPESYLTDVLGLNLNIFKWVNTPYTPDIEYKDGLTLEIVTTKFPWLLDDDVLIYGSIIGYKNNKLIWYSGDWVDGTWKDGIWKDGEFTGIWKGGIFEDGMFNGKWYSGIFKGGRFWGKWYGGEWEGLKFEGEWLDPKRRKPLNIKEYKDGLTMDIIKFKFPWLLEEDVDIDDTILGYDKSTKKLIWYSGKWNSGTWKDGIWKDGAFFSKGIWEGGIFEDGMFNGKWYGGEWKSSNFYGKWLDPKNPKPLNVKEYRDGLTDAIVRKQFSWLLDDDTYFINAILGYKGNKLIWYNGDWNNGTWKDGTFEDGWFGGKWYGGIFEDGSFWGKWYGGEWKGGVFRGQWLDPNNPKPE